MDKYSKITEAFSLVNIAFRGLMDLADELRKEAKDFLICKGVKDPDDLIKEDFIEWFKIEHHRKEVTKRAEKLQNWLDDLIELKI